MRIGIYAELARDSKPTGIGLHVRELLKALASIDPDNDYLLYYPVGTIPRREPLLELNLPANFASRPVRFPSDWPGIRPRLWWQWYLPWILRRDRIDVFHGPNHFVPRLRQIPSVVTIHDVAYFHMCVHGPAGDAFMRDWTQRSLSWSKAVIALSENTRHDIEQLGVPTERIRVIYGGGHTVPDADIRTDRIDELRKSYGLPENFILFVGTLQPRKNVPFLIRAFAKAKRELTIPYKLVLAGHRGSAGAELEALARTLGVADDLIITGYVDDWQVPLLYQLADLFVMPTLYEGFGMCNLEAMAYGTPVIATDTSCIRESVGDAALLVPADDETALSDAIVKVLTEPSIRESLIQRGRNRATLFTWKRNAEQTLEIYEGLHARRPTIRQIETSSIA